MKVQIGVQFYNEEERKLLAKNYPSVYKNLESLTNSNIAVSYEEFKTYSQFHQQNIGMPDFSSYQMIKKITPQSFGKVEVYTKYNKENECFNSKYDHANEQNDVSESIGCAGSLSVLSYAFGLTEADWKRIHVSDHKDFDFDSSVIDDFKKLIVVEAKGSIVPDNNASSKHNRVTAHKSRIKEKKKDEKFKSNYPNGADLLIGAITVADPQNHLKVLLVDPPTDSDLNDLLRRKVKLLKRLSYYFDYLKTISERSQLTLALFNRLRILEKLNNVTEVDNIVLKSPNNERIELSQGFIDSHSHINRRIIGSIIPITINQLLFIGLPVEVYKMLSVQYQSEILSYKVEPKTFKERIECTISIKKAMQSNFFKGFYSFLNNKSDSHFRFYANNCDIIQASSGLTYSIIRQKNITPID